MILDYSMPGKHVMVDALVIAVYMNTCLREGVVIPGYANKQADARKLYADRASPKPFSSTRGGPHVLVPFATEDGVRLGPMHMHSC